MIFLKTFHPFYYPWVSTESYGLTSEIQRKRVLEEGVSWKF